MENELLKIVSLFDVKGDIKDVRPFGNGLINKTYLVETTEEKYMLQYINSYAFKNVDSLMRNIYIVTKHLSEKGIRTLEVIKTLNNKIYIESNGAFYRLYKYIDNSICYEDLDSPILVRKAAKAFGFLHNQLSDLDPILIAETIPDFHNTPKRYNNLMDAVKADPNSRVANCFPELNYIMSNKSKISMIMNGLEDGSIPERIVHNDPKINNVLFDKETGKIKCVIDLDTVMPGCCLFDVGDALRSIYTGNNESALDSSLLKVDLDVFETYVKGYCESMGDALTQKEIDLFPYSVFTLALELAIRFLEDYIRGDVYFKTTFEGENLVRAKNQIALAKDVMANIEKMEEITRKAASNGNN